MSTPVLASDIVLGLETANRRLKSRLEDAGKRMSFLERRISLLEAEIVALKSDQSLAPFIEPPFGLSRSENVVFTLLMARQIVFPESLQEVLYSSRPNDEPEIKTVTVFVSHVRKKLGKLNFRIEHRKQGGWFITPDTKTRIRNLLNQGADDHDRHERRERIHPATPPNGSPAAA